MRDAEAVARYDVHVVAVEQLARGVGHRVHDDVEPVPVVVEVREDRFDLLVGCDVAGQHDVGLGLRGVFLHALFELVVLVGVGELGALPMHGLGDAPGDGPVARHAHDQRAFSCQESHAVTPFVLVLVVMFRVSRRRILHPDELSRYSSGISGRREGG